MCIIAWEMTVIDDCTALPPFLKTLFFALGSVKYWLITRRSYRFSTAIIYFLKLDISTFPKMYDSNPPSKWYPWPQNRGSGSWTNKRSLVMWFVSIRILSFFLCFLCYASPRMLDFHRIFFYRWQTQQLFGQVGPGL